MPGTLPMGRTLSVLALLGALASAGCSDNSFGANVDILVEITATPTNVTFQATLESRDEADIDFSGTTPFTAEFSDRTIPVEVSVRRPAGPTVTLLVCLTNLDSGRRRCRDTDASSVRVEL